MPTPSSNVADQKSLTLLSRLLLPPGQLVGGTPNTAAIDPTLVQLDREAFDNLVALASSNHVIMRAMEVFLLLTKAANDTVRSQWAETALAEERSRIQLAMSFLKPICAAFDEEGKDVTVIKSLDHWPDLGSDLDLYTNTDSDQVIDLMHRRFGGTTAARSWGDRLARKWNFDIPGLPEAVEIHMSRLGQTGEQIVIAASIAKRSREVQVDGQTFRVPAVSDRLMISTLQRMYRHFYFRLCDIIDSAGLVEANMVNYEDLRRSATAAGIWEGVATYMVIVSDYVKQYRGTGLELPAFVREAARFGGELVFFRKEFLRVPILPQSAKLYGSQMTGLLKRGELHSSARLSLLPWLATAAAVGQKITGSDKGIW